MQSITIKEVGPRDGLQNEPTILSPEIKARFIEQLADAGLKYIEAGAFVSPKQIPQMANTDRVFKSIKRKARVCYSALVPNEKGFELALDCNVDEIAVFTACSETFCQHNIRCSIDESFARFDPILTKAKALKIPVRGYLSCVLGCPYEGEISPKIVAKYSARLIEMGCYEVSLGDTIGVGTPQMAKQMYQAVTERINSTQTALHFHDTYGRALANVMACLPLGAQTIDSAVSGLGGCPYAPGASGNLATENLVDCLHLSGYETGVNLSALLSAADYINTALKRQQTSAVGLAYQGKKS